MLSVFRNVSYAKLFSAQFIALVGTGLLTVALGLLAYDVAGSQASMVPVSYTHLTLPTKLL